MGEVRSPIAGNKTSPLGHFLGGNIEKYHYRNILLAELTILSIVFPQWELIPIGFHWGNLFRPHTKEQGAMIAINFLSKWGCNIICVPVSNFVTPEGVNECRYLCNGKPRADFRPDVVVSATHLACSLDDKPSVWCRDKENWVSLYPECENDDPIIVLGTSQVIAA